jgi:putative PIN family toxin of toxin-antitoxin system
MPKNNTLKLIIDTNLWVSFLISNTHRKLDALLIENKVILLFSEALITEVEQTISKPRLKKYFSENALQEMLEVFEPYIELIEVRSIVSVCRDPDDNFLLALAKDGKANYLITGDQDLLVLKKFGKTRIVTITAFLKKIE